MISDICKRLGVLFKMSWTRGGQGQNPISPRRVPVPLGPFVSLGITAIARDNPVHGDVDIVRDIVWSGFIKGT